MSKNRRIYRTLHVLVAMVVFVLASCSRGADTVPEKLAMYVPDDVVAVATVDISAHPDMANMMFDAMDGFDTPLLKAVIASPALERTNCVVATRRNSGVSVSAIILSVSDDDEFVDGLVDEIGLMRGTHDGAECAFGDGIAVVADAGVGMIFFVPGQKFTARNAVTRMVAWHKDAEASPLSEWKSEALIAPSPVAFYADADGFEDVFFGMMLDIAPESVRTCCLLGRISADGPDVKAVVEFVKPDGTPAESVFGDASIDISLFRYIHDNECFVGAVGNFEACYDRFRPVIAEAGFDELLTWIRPGPAVLAFGPRGALDMTVFAEPSVADWDFTAVYAIGGDACEAAISSLTAAAKEAGVMVNVDRADGVRILRIPAGYEFDDGDEDPRLSYIDVYVGADEGNMILSTRPISRRTSMPACAQRFVEATFGAELNLPVGSLRPFGCEAGLNVQVYAAGNSVVLHAVATETDANFMAAFGPLLGEII